MKTTDEALIVGAEAEKMVTQRAETFISNKAYPENMQNHINTARERAGLVHEYPGRVPETLDQLEKKKSWMADQTSKRDALLPKRHHD